MELFLKKSMESFHKNLSAKNIYNNLLKNFWRNIFEYFHTIHKSPVILILRVPLVIFHSFSYPLLDYWQMDIEEGILLRVLEKSIQEQFIGNFPKEFYEKFLMGYLLWNFHNKPSFFFQINHWIILRKEWFLKNLRKIPWVTSGVYSKEIFKEFSKDNLGEISK